MLTKTKIVLAMALFAATSSAALAQGFDPNMANRYPSYAAPQSYGYVVGSNSPASMHQSQHASVHSAPVWLLQGRNVALTNDQTGIVTGQPSPLDVDRADRASSPYAGGGF